MHASQSLHVWTRSVPHLSLVNRNVSRCVHRCCELKPALRGAMPFFEYLKRQGFEVLCHARRGSMIAIDSAVPRREEGTRTDDDMSASSMVSHPGRLPASLPHHTSVHAVPVSSHPRPAGGMRSCLGAVAAALLAA